MELTQINHTSFDPPGPEGLTTYEPIICQFRVLDGIMGASCDAIFQWGSGPPAPPDDEDEDAMDAADTDEGLEEETQSMEELEAAAAAEEEAEEGGGDGGEDAEEDIDVSQAATYLQAKFVLSEKSAPAAVPPPEEPPGDLKEAGAKHFSDASGMTRAKDLMKKMASTTFDIYMALSSGIRKDVGNAIVEKQKKEAHHKKMKLVRWQQACEASKIQAPGNCGDDFTDDVPVDDAEKCDEVLWTAIKKCHTETLKKEDSDAKEAELQKYSFPELYEVEDGDLDPDSPFLDEANEDVKCMAIAGIYEKRRKLFETFGKTTKIVAAYTLEMTKGWKQEDGFKDANYALNGQVDCPKTCQGLNGWLSGVRFACSPYTVRGCSTFQPVKRTFHSEQQPGPHCAYCASISDVVSIQIL